MSTVSDDSLPPEFEECLGGRRDGGVGPGQEVELGDGARLSGAGVLQVEAADQVIVTPNVLRDEMNLPR